jgi:hypothetical protein
MLAYRHLLKLEGITLEVWRVDDEFRVRYANCYVKDGIFLRRVYGAHNTFEDACIDYIEKINGKTLIFNARSKKKRKEVTVLL